MINQTADLNKPYWGKAPLSLDLAYKKYAIAKLLMFYGAKTGAELD